MFEANYISEKQNSKISPTPFDSGGMLIFDNNGKNGQHGN